MILLAWVALSVGLVAYRWWAVRRYERSRWTFVGGPLDGVEIRLISDPHLPTAYVHEGRGEQWTYVATERGRYVLRVHHYTPPNDPRPAEWARLPVTR